MAHSSIFNPKQPSIQLLQDTGLATRSKSSARWLKEHFSDPFVKRAQNEGWRSRAVFKLEELIDRDKLLKPGMIVVDLGAAPGGWSQMVRERLGDSGRIVALDILPMQGIAGVADLGNRRTVLVLDVAALIGEALGTSPGADARSALPS